MSAHRPPKPQQETFLGLALTTGLKQEPTSANPAGTFEPTLTDC